MPRGGRRPGAGRPRKHPKPAPEAQKEATQQPASPAPAEYKPLEYMLKVMNDSNENAEMRARMAVAAAPYVHAKAGDAGKKEQKNEAAKRVATRFGASAPPPRSRDSAAH